MYLMFYTIQEATILVHRILTGPEYRIYLRTKIIDNLLIEE